MKESKLVCNLNRHSKVGLYYVLNRASPESICIYLVKNQVRQATYLPLCDRFFDLTFSILDTIQTDKYGLYDKEF